MKTACYELLKWLNNYYYYDKNPGVYKFLNILLEIVFYACGVGHAIQLGLYLFILKN